MLFTLTAAVVLCLLFHGCEAFHCQNFYPATKLSIVGSEFVPELKYNHVTIWRLCNFEADWPRELLRRARGSGTLPPNCRSHSQEAAFEAGTLCSTGFRLSTSPCIRNTNHLVPPRDIRHVPHPSGAHRHRYMHLTRYSPIDEDSPDNHPHRNTYIHTLVS